jgi:transketolase
MRDAFISELTILAEEDPSVFLIVGDLGFSVIEEFAAQFPDRFLNVGVAEQTMIGVAAGLAAFGYKVFVYSIANFPTVRCLEQIRNDVCYHGRSVTVVSVGGGLSYGNLGYTHHAIEDLALMRALPNMRVFSPGDPVEARALTRYAVEHPGPAYLRLGKNGEAVLPREAVGPVAPDIAQVLRAGDDIALIATGSIAGSAVKAAELLAERGVSARVISVPFVKPLPSAVLDAVSDVQAIVTIEEHSEVAGFGSAVLEAASKRRMAAHIDIIGLPESLAGRFIGSQSYLRERGGLSPEVIADRALTLVESPA